MRREIRRFIDEQNFDRAVDTLVDHVSVEIGFNRLHSLSKLIDAIPRESFLSRGFAHKRLAILGSSTTGHVAPLLRLFAAKRHVLLDVWECDHGLYEQAVHSIPEALRVFAPDVVHFHINNHDVAARADEGKSFESHLEEERSRFHNLFLEAERQLDAIITYDNFACTGERAFGNLDARAPLSRNVLIRELNRELARSLPPRILVHDVELLSSKIGKDRWVDPRFWHFSKNAVALDQIPHYARNYGSLLAAVAGKSRKCIVVDLDGTLWGGVVGDDGLDGIVLDEESPVGEAFLDFQRYLLELNRRGILLAICSKNDPAVALEVFRRHESMILEEKHFACTAINWERKDENLRSISRELGLSLDAFVFFDDNPAERELVKTNLPEVWTVDVPEDPSFYVRCLDGDNLFDTVSVTSEDLERARQYSANVARGMLAESEASYDSYLEALKMSASFEPFSPELLPRITQLVNKTNQFNVTTRRYSEQDLGKFMADGSTYTASVRLSDRFGNNGLISALVGRIHGEVLTIDTWVMSCRVLKRGVEYLHFEKLLDFCQDRGVTTVYGDYIPTPKNELVRNLFAELGFENVENTGDGSGEPAEMVRWRFALGRSRFEHQHRIRLKETEEHDSSYSGDRPTQRDFSRSLG